MQPEALQSELAKAGEIIVKMADKDIFTWLDSKAMPSNTERH